MFSLASKSAFAEEFFIGSATGTTTAVMPTHQAGDLLIGFAFRDGSTTGPTIPAGWTELDRRGENSCSASLAYKVAASDSETSGTWTNASSLIVIVLRNAENPEGYVDGFTGDGFDFSSAWLPFTTSSPWRMLFFAGMRAIDTSAENRTSISALGFSSNLELLANVIDATDQCVAYLASSPITVLGAEGFILDPTGGGTSSGYMTASMSVKQS